MFNSAILEVATGIVFIYLVLSLMCTALREGLEGILRTRASYLESGIRELLFDKEGTELAKSFYEHPLIFSLFPGGYKSTAAGKTAGPLTRGNLLPAYIPAGNFASALMDLIARGPASLITTSAAAAPAAATHPITISDVRASLATIGNSPVRRAVLAALDTANDDLEKAKKNLEHWYDSAMDRVSGRYKRSTQLVLFCIGIAVSVGFNIDTLDLADYLYRNETQRGAIVAQASLANGNQQFLESNYANVRKQIDDLRLPIGWDFFYNKTNLTTSGQDANVASASASASASDQTHTRSQFSIWVMKGLGWLLTAFAVTLGAPFWFDILNKIMVIRSTVKPHEKSPEEASEDRQSGSDTSRSGAPPTAVIQLLSAATPPAVAADAALDGEQDGCDAEVDKPTADNELPAAEGGVN